MERGTTSKPSADGAVATLERPFELELADGTRLIPQPEAHPARLEGHSNHAFSLADVLREDGEPFAGYRLQRD